MSSAAREGLQPGEAEKARSHYEEALTIQRDEGARAAAGVTLGRLAQLHQEAGRPDEARAHFESALAIHRELGDQLREGSVLAFLGILHMERRLMEEAGFTIYEWEWWHFDFRDWRQYRIEDVPFEDIDS